MVMAADSSGNALNSQIDANNFVGESDQRNGGGDKLFCFVKNII